MFYLEGKLVDKNDLTLLQAYTLRIEDGITRKTFDKLHFAFPQAPIKTLRNTERHIQFLSGFQPIQYDCFVMCMLYWPI